MSTQSEDYTVGWICAIPVEYIAACELLDEEYGNDQIPKVDTRYDSNLYTFGRIHEHNVVIACLPQGRYGITSAAVVARDMRSSFPALRFGLLVGIAGGAPSQKHDIRLGDVVVSSPTPRHGGVLQYDFGKALEEKRFEETGHLGPPPEVLLIALSNIKMQHARRGHRIASKVANMLSKNKRLHKDFSRPDIASDELYGQSSPGEHHLVVRENRDPGDDDPVIHYGLIASANSLMKDRSIRNALVENYDVLCFEMEAAGLMNNFPCLVIRGICDYSDAHKNDSWQGYAAANAAAYAKELLEIIPGKDLLAMKSIEEAGKQRWYSITIV